MIGPITTAMAEERLREYLQDVRTCSVVIVDQRTDGIYAINDGFGLRFLETHFNHIAKIARMPPMGRSRKLHVLVPDIIVTWTNGRHPWQRS